jgi:soluble lytic murein transglycosylase
MRVLSILSSLLLVLAVGFDPIAADKSMQKRELVRLNFAQEIHGQEFHKSAAYSQVTSSKEISKRIKNILEAKLPQYSLPYRRDFQKTLEQESYLAKIDPLYVVALIQTESKFNPLAIGSVGEQGLMQIKPSTAKWLDEMTGDYNPKRKVNLFDPMVNIKYGIKYLTYLRTVFPKDSVKYVNAYNRGPTKAKVLTRKRIEKFYAKMHKAEKSKQLIYSDRILATYNDLNSRSYRDQL